MSALKDLFGKFAEVFGLKSIDDGFYFGMTVFWSVVFPAFAGYMVHGIVGAGIALALVFVPVAIIMIAPNIRFRRKRLVRPEPTKA